jgi:hypothetical protein
MAYIPLKRGKDIKKKIALFMLGAANGNAAVVSQLYYCLHNLAAAF